MEHTPSEFENVIHKKVAGKVVLSENGLVFHPSISSSATTTTSPTLGWNIITKHQVSPASYPKSLLKLVLADGRSSTFQFASRTELERIRKEITIRLQTYKTQQQQQAAPIASASAPASPNGKKRPHSEINGGDNTVLSYGRTSSGTFGELDPTALAVTRSSLLAANPSLRSQHQYLVQETETLTEDDFWKTHQDLLEEEYARISGMTRAGTSSLLQAHLQLLTGRVTLGVEEMRQIFILYPAVHKAYEEKVPLELSDEQFWRKYLESEYFHRDRGRIGAASKGGSDSNNNNNKKSKAPSMEEQEARAAAIGTDDLFSRYDQKLRETANSDEGSRKWGTNLAVGQFDLASTFATERGDILEGPKDNHPPSTDDGKGAKVIQKYNRHWAMVMHPEDAVAGSDLMQVSRKSVSDVIPGDEDAKAGGGADADMQRLVGFAMASAQDANHALGIGLEDSDDYEPLTLKNIEAYYSQHKTTSSNGNNNNNHAAGIDDGEQRRRNAVLADALVSKMKLLEAAVMDAQAKRGAHLIDEAFPPPKLGTSLLKALTKKMAIDSKTDADTLEVVNSLPEDFKKRLHSYFRRTSELLRHFFGLRRLAEESQSGAYNPKLKKIVTGMETVYRDMEGMRKELEATGETGEIMRKMCLQIMDQVERAFKLHREGTGGGSGGGGFVTIEEY
eukprot:scaffold9951_cov146-Cylindrotheca_fusiformis.AAC.4